MKILNPWRKNTEETIDYKYGPETNEVKIMVNRIKKLRKTEIARLANQVDILSNPMQLQIANIKVRMFYLAMEHNRIDNLRYAEEAAKEAIAALGRSASIPDSAKTAIQSAVVAVVMRDLMTRQEYEMLYKAWWLR